MYVSYEMVKAQIDIVAIRNQQLGVYELSHNLTPSKSGMRKLNTAKTEVRNATMILKNMVRGYGDSRRND